MNCTDVAQERLLGLMASCNNSNKSFGTYQVEILCEVSKEDSLLWNE